LLLFPLRLLSAIYNILTLNVLGEAIPDLVGHHVIEEAEVLALFLAQVLLDQLKQLLNAFSPTIIVIL
jgi:hypothetical protein